MVSEPPTGEPDAGNLPVRFGGRAKLIFVPTPILAREPVGLWSRFRPVGPGGPSPGFSLGLEFGHFFVAGRSAARFFSLSDGLEHQIQGGGLNRQGLLPGWG
jgi:hypothetical protein